MPTYEYECGACHRVFEVRQRISEPALETCDACGGPVRRLLSPAPFILKGAGWYVTDYPSESRKKAMASEKPAGGDSKAESKADSGGKAEKRDDATAKTTTSAPAPAPSTPSAAD